MKCLCLQAMTIVYGRHHADIGPFHDTKYIVAMLDRTCDRVERYVVELYIPQSFAKTQRGKGQGQSFVYFL